jgi:hypothetical protein
MNVVDRHIQRYIDTIFSLRSVTVEYVQWKIGIDDSFIEARLRFWDGSMLEIRESIIPELALVVNKTEYAFHYQDANGQLVLRYDNAPHHPEISTHPHHKHIEDRIESAQVPDLSDVLREIDQILSARG